MKRLASRRFSSATLSCCKAASAASAAAASPSAEACGGEAAGSGEEVGVGIAYCTSNSIPGRRPAGTSTAISPPGVWTWISAPPRTPAGTVTSTRPVGEPGGVCLSRGAAAVPSSPPPGLTISTPSPQLAPAWLDAAVSAWPG